MIDLADRIELDSKPPLHKTRRRLFEGCYAVISIAAILRPIDLGSHSRPNRLGGHAVILTDAEVDQWAVWIVGQRLAFSPLDLFELVDVGPFAIAGTTD